MTALLRACEQSGRSCFLIRTVCALLLAGLLCRLALRGALHISPLLAFPGGRAPPPPTARTLCHHTTYSRGALHRVFEPRSRPSATRDEPPKPSLHCTRNTLKHTHTATTANVPPPVRTQACARTTHTHQPTRPPFALAYSALPGSAPELVLTTHAPTHSFTPASSAPRRKSRSLCWFDRSCIWCRAAGDAQGILRTRYCANTVHVQYPINPQTCRVARGFWSASVRADVCALPPRASGGAGPIAVPQHCRASARLNAAARLPRAGTLGRWQHGAPAPARRRRCWLGICARLRALLACACARAPSPLLPASGPVVVALRTHTPSHGLGSACMLEVVRGNRPFTAFCEMGVGGQQPCITAQIGPVGMYSKPEAIRHGKHQRGRIWKSCRCPQE